MSSTSPASILFSTDGYELSVVNGSAIPTGTRGILMEGSDGTNSRFITIDSSGRVITAGAGTAGTPAGGVLTIQGVSGGTVVPVSGTVTANAGTGNFIVIGTGTDNTTNSTAKLPVLAALANTAAPTWTNGNMAPLSVDTAGALRVTGTVTAANASVSATGAAPPASATYIGGSVTTAAPAYTTGQMSALSLTTTGLLRVDGSGVTQPVSGTITANVGTTGGLALDATLAKLTIAQSTALGANTQALVGGSVTTAAPTYTTGNINPLSLTTAGALRTDSSATTQPVSGTVTSNIGTTNGLALDATLTGGTQRTKITDGTTNAAVKAASTAAVAADPALVVAISPNNTLSVITDKSTTGTITSVAGAITNTSVLASNAARVSATVYNATNKTMYLALGASASTSAYTIQIFQGSYWELPVSYTGAISAVWASGVSGSALVTELS